MSRLHRQQVTAAALQQLSLQPQPPLPQHPLPPQPLQPHPPSTSDNDVDMSGTGNHQGTPDGPGHNGNPGTPSGSTGSPNVDQSLAKPFTRVSLRIKEMVCSQFHQCFMCKFYVQKSFWQVFLLTCKLEKSCWKDVRKKINTNFKTQFFHVENCQLWTSTFYFINFIKIKIMIILLGYYTTIKWQ